MTGRDYVSGICLALGVLLKYLPVVLCRSSLWITALDPAAILRRGRRRDRAWFRARLLGMGGDDVPPLTFAATRRSNCMSIFYFLRGRFSPLNLFLAFTNCDSRRPVRPVSRTAAGVAMVPVGECGLEHACVVAVIVTAIFYHTGFPQYHMVPFVLGSDWALHHWELLRDLPFRVVAMASYFAWLALFECYYLFADQGSLGGNWYVLQDIVGLPTFLVGCAFLGGGGADGGRAGEPGCCGSAGHRGRKGRRYRCRSVRVIRTGPMVWVMSGTDECPECQGQWAGFR